MKRKFEKYIWYLFMRKGRKEELPKFIQTCVQ